MDVVIVGLIAVCLFFGFCAILDALFGSHVKRRLTRKRDVWDEHFASDAECATYYGRDSAPYTDDQRAAVWRWMKEDDAYRKKILKSINKGKK